MAEFRFPKGESGTKVVAPNGIVYVWDEDNGRWAIESKRDPIAEIVTISSDEPDGIDGDLWYSIGSPGNNKLHVKNGKWEQVAPGWEQYQADIEGMAKVWYGDDPPTDEHYQFWWDETQLELCIKAGDMWWPASSGLGGDLGGVEVWYGENEPDESNYSFWFDTSRLELLVRYNSQWWPVSIPADQLEDLRKTFERELQGVFDETARIENEAFQAIRALGLSLDLNQVLENGAISNKGMVLKTSDPNIEGSSEYDAIELIPAAARIAVTAEDNAGFKPSIEFVEVVKGNAGATRRAQIELDDNTLDINVATSEDQIHFQFNEDPLLVLRKIGGPSELSGKLVVEPGTSGNQVVTYGQLTTIEEEIQQLAPAFDRGSWTWIDSDTPQVGHYTIVKEADQDGLDACLSTFEQCTIDNALDPPALSQCQRDYDACKALYEEGPTDDFSKTKTLIFSRKDSKGQNHEFPDIKDGTLIDLFNDSNDNFLVASATGPVTLTDDYITVDVNIVQSKGSASGTARTKIFEVAENADVSNFVRKSGDTMTGQLTVERSNIDFTALQIKGQSLLEGRTILAKDRDQNSTSQVLQIVGNKLLMQANIQKQGSSDDDWIEYTGGIKENSSLVNKQYVDDALTNLRGPALLRWKYQKPASGKGPADGTFWLDSNHYRFSYKTANGVNLGATKPANRDEWYAAGAGDDKGAFDMTLWRKTSSGWYMYDHIECDKTRWSITTDGVTHFQFRRKWASHDKSLGNGQSYYITVAGFF